MNLFTWWSNIFIDFNHVSLPHRDSTMIKNYYFSWQVPHKKVEKNELSVVMPHCAISEEVDACKWLMRDIGCYWQEM
jgi:hypothetical protein